MNTLVVLTLLAAAVVAIDENTFVFEQPGNDGVHWAFLVAGSNGYYNYRHQADVCHAYQIMKKHGIPDERIVVMQYDDIAQSPQNPTKGIIINQPNGPDVYHGVLKDYTGEDVDPQIFLNVLQGKKDAVRGVGSGKVIDSGPNDHVFVNFVDHGAPHILGFGNKVLKDTQLLDAIKYMHDNQKYAKMVFYVEACESGSMFENELAKNINVFATTASNSHESSYACYFDKKRQTYLGDVYSVMWMQDSDKENLRVETLQKQFLITKNDTNTSHVQEYGDLTMSSLTVAEFQGTQQDNSFVFPAPNPNLDAVKSEDVPLEILKHKFALAEPLERVEIMVEIKKMELERENVKKVVKSIVGTATSNNAKARLLMSERYTLTRKDCYFAVLDYLMAECKTLNLPENDYALRHLYIFANMCQDGVPQETIFSAIDKQC